MSSRVDAFAPRDWAFLAGVALMWGSSFALIDVGLEHLQPTTVAWLRVLFGAAMLALVPAARRPVARADWRGVALLGLVWMAAPFMLFALAQRSIDSSLAGMVNGAAPLFTVVVATLWSRRLPGGRQSLGLFVGFAGVVAISWPAVQGATTTAIGAAMVLLATLCYGIAFNLAVPLEERNGALPVIWRAQLAALVVLSVPGLVGATQSSWSWSAMLALVVLGALSTGLAFVMFTILAGRVGASRGSITVYFIPIVAIALGVLFRDESVALVAIGGTTFVLLGAYLTSRKERGVVITGVAER